jgi:hypothetical protein
MAGSWRCSMQRPTVDASSATAATGPGREQRTGCELGAVCKHESMHVSCCCTVLVRSRTLVAEVPLQCCTHVPKPYLYGWLTATWFARHATRHRSLMIMPTNKETPHKADMLRCLCWSVVLAHGGGMITVLHPPSVALCTDQPQSNSPSSTPCRPLEVRRTWQQYSDGQGPASISSAARCFKRLQQQQPHRHACVQPLNIHGRSIIGGCQKRDPA